MTGDFCPRCGRGSRKKEGTKINSADELRIWAEKNGHRLVRCEGEFSNQFQLICNVEGKDEFITLPYLYWQFLLGMEVWGKYTKGQKLAMNSDGIYDGIMEDTE